jgi:hypothetical protein
MTELRECQLCGESAEIINEQDFHMSFARYEGDTVELNFLHHGAIQCTNCGLTLPFFGGEENKQDNIKFWNGEDTTS